MNRLRMTCLKSIRAFLFYIEKLLSQRRGGHWLNLPRIRADVLKAHQKKKKPLALKSRSSLCIA